MAATQKRRRAADAALTAVFSLISLAYVFPLVMVLLNSFKRKAYISRAPFALPTGNMFVRLDNYRNGIRLTDFWASMLWSFVITVLSVALILLCTSMCAWYISRVRNRITHSVYLLCIFSMVVPFQMVMFTLSKVANVLGLNTPWTIPVIYLGFGAGLAVFLFTGYMKACPIAIEESATIDGCSPLRTFSASCCPFCSPLSSPPAFCRPCGSGTITCCPTWFWISSASRPFPSPCNISGAATAVWIWAR